MKTEKKRLEGLVAAPFTSMHQDGSLNCAAIPDFVRLLESSGVSGAFISGTTGEGMSLTIEEREAVTAAWTQAPTTDLKVVVHVGHNSLADCGRLAAHAEACGAWGIGQMTPTFFKPPSLDELVEFCADTAAHAPSLPYYYYHIPSMTGLNVKMVDFLLAAKDRIPNLAGVKYTYEDLMDLQLCRHLEDGRFDMLFGRDELLVCGLTLGCTGAVGSTYNYLAPLYVKLWEAFDQQDLAEANRLQLLSMKIIELLFQHGNPQNCGKAIMAMLGVDCGPMRLPLRGLTDSQTERLKASLEDIGFFEHCCRLDPIYANA